MIRVLESRFILREVRYNFLLLSVIAAIVEIPVILNWWYFAHRNIKRLIFSTLEKFDGQSMTELSVSQAKQIAGRAGRFGTEHSEGEVTT